jgi:predicted MFS family arabinose efflux permease
MRVATSRTGFPTGSFLRYWRAAAVSGFGTYVTAFALQTLVVLTLNGSAADVGWLNATETLPYLVFGLIVGAIVDGRRRLPLLIRTDLVQAVLLLAIPVLWWAHRLSMPALLVIVFVYGSAAVVNVAAAMSFLPRLVEAQHLQPAHARIDGADAVSMTAGPAVGGLVVAAVGAPFAVLLDSLTYVYSAVTLRRLDVAEPVPRTGVSVKDLLREVVEGFRWAYGGSGLFTLAMFTHGWFVGHAIVMVLLAPYVLSALGFTAFQFGLIGAIGGLGAIAGATVTTWVGRRLGTGRTIILCHAIITLGVTALVLAGGGEARAGTFALLALGQGLYGLAMGMSNSHETSYRQLVTPDELQARTNTTLRSLNRTVVVVVSPLAGILADAWGIRSTMALAAVVFALVAVGLAGSSFRNVRAPA